MEHPLHQSLKNYLNELRIEFPKLDFPNFCTKTSTDVCSKHYLAILQDPGHSGATKTRECSVVINKDKTTSNQRKALNQVGIDPENILFWNFYPFFDWQESKSETHSEPTLWAKKIEKLIEILPNLKIILFFGNVAWLGARYVNTNGKPILWSPHPSGRGLSNEAKYQSLQEAWKRAKQISEAAITAK